MATIVAHLGYAAGYCGYCGQDDTSYKFGLWAFSLSAEHYQALIDQGWRRSGNYLYKPDVLRSCCPQYPIRLQASRFKPSRDQRKTIHRFNKFILGETMDKESRSHTNKRKDEFDLATAVNAANFSSLVNMQPAHRFEVSLESNEFTEEKYELYKQYQINVHHDSAESISHSSFKRFLCDSPMLACERDGKLFGSYHQCYRIDGVLVAIGVIDLLPHSVSSVYCITSEAFASYSFGKLTAFHEIILALEKYEYEYMGYYIHDIPKMQYKANFKPSEILDPATNEWHSIEDLLPTARANQALTIDESSATASSNITDVLPDDMSGIWPESAVSPLLCKVRCFDLQSRRISTFSPHQRVKLLETLRAIGPDISQDTVYIDVA